MPTVPIRIPKAAASRPRVAYRLPSDPRRSMPQTATMNISTGPILSTTSAMGSTSRSKTT
jgi:hypothetical protein